MIAYDGWMNDPLPTNEQTHPLYVADRSTVDRLLAKTSPDPEDLIDLARLLIRYEGFPGATDLQSDMAKILNLWGISKESLNSRTKEIWNKGFRPGYDSVDEIGSGFDTSDNSAS